MTVVVQPGDYHIETREITVSVPTIDGVYDADYLVEYYEKKNIPGNARKVIASQTEFTTYIYLSWYETTVNAVEIMPEEGKDWIS